MTSRVWMPARLLGGVLVLGLLGWRLGGGPFVDGLRRVDASSLLLALLVAVPTTAACAWRWGLVARGLGLRLTLRGALLSCYRSQFLNSTLPGGVLGDVHRALRHRRDVDPHRRFRALRAVAWERGVGQVVQVVLTLAVLALSPSVLGLAPASLSAVLAGGVLLAAFLLVVARGRLDLGAVGADLRALASLRTWAGMVLASGLAVLGHVATFVVAARTAGTTASLGVLLPLALLVLVAMAVPVNVAGWGPREGVAAWAFAAAGLGSAQGVAASVVYGVMALVASLPGALVLGADLVHGRGVRAVAHA